ncbi:MAG: nuclear transport factor 2 family protein [Candidatus Acidiferrales bacterium]
MPFAECLFKLIYEVHILSLAWFRPSRDANLTYATKQKYFVQPRLRLQELGARFPQSDVGPDSGRGEENGSHREQAAAAANFDELSKGNSELFVASMADDFRWTVTGTTKWSRTYEGKQSVLVELFGPLRARIDGRIRTTAHRLIAEGDYVVVEARGSNTTKRGATVQ